MLYRCCCRYLRIFGRGALKALPTIAQISIILAVLTFFQQQDPLVAAHIDHETKLLSLTNSGLIPVSIRSYAMQFHLNYIQNPGAHRYLDKDKPIDSFLTRGSLVPSFTVWPLSTRTRDLAKTGLGFEEWNNGQSFDDTVYCLAFEKTSWLGKVNIDALLTPKLKFPASLFGPINSNSEMGGGYSADFFDVEKKIKENCLVIFEKAR